MHLEHLIERVGSSADWRAGKAAEYPNDKRNHASSQALSKLAENLRKVSADNEHAQAYEAAVQRLLDLNETDEASEYEAHYVGRYGFDYPADSDPEDFLLALAERYQDVANEAEEEAAKEERERRYEAALEAADEEDKEAAAEEAKEAAEEAAKEAAEVAYRAAYEEAYKEVYEEVYKEALIRALQEEDDEE